MSDRPAPGSGQIILLNGASSAGKSTIARRLQQELDRPFWHLSIDHFRDAGVLPLERVRAGDFRWSALRSAFFDGFLRALPVYAHAGNNLILEHIVETEAWRSLLVELLAPFDVFFVGIHCPLEVLEQREAVRGDRPLGDARSDFGRVHRAMDYDLELDGTEAPARNVAFLLRAWRQRSHPSAFDRLAARRCLGSP